MRQLQKKSRKKPLIITLIILALLAAAGAAAYILLRPQQSTQQQTSESTSTENTSGQDESTQQPDVKPDETQKGVDDPSISTNPDTANGSAFPTTKPNLAITITSLTQQQGSLRLATSISPSAKGTCTVELTRPESEPIKKSASFDGKSCGITSLDVSTAAKGEWNLSVKIMVASNVATDTKSVVLK